MPTQTFNTIQDLITYINQYIIPNGIGEITGEEHNNVENGLAAFIETSKLNYNKASLISSGGVVVLPSAFSVIMGPTPTSLSWLDNIYNEYYIINATGFDIPLAPTFVYYDTYLEQQTTVPARTVLHIVKATNNQWILATNLPASSGGALPPQGGHIGEALFTTGASPFWFTTILPIESVDFELDGRTYINAALNGLTYEILYNDINRFIYQKESPKEWNYITGGGFEVLLDGFNANDFNVHLYIFLKGSNA